MELNLSKEWLEKKATLESSAADVGAGSLPDALPCPFCASQELGNGLNLYCDNVGFYVGCRTCGARSGWVSTGLDDAQTKAIVKWNTRVAVTSAIQCLCCKEKFAREDSIACGTQLSDQFCTPECERRFRKK